MPIAIISIFSRIVKDCYSLVKLNEELQAKVKEFEHKFSIFSANHKIIKIDNLFRINNFNPSEIEKLKPPKFRLWAEKFLPQILVRDIKFWSSPVSITSEPVSITLMMPIGIKKKSEMTFEFKDNLSEQAIKIMNEYLYNSLDSFVSELNQQYTSALEQFINEWYKCLRDYLRQIEVVKVITEPSALIKIDNFVMDIKYLSEEIANLMSQD